MKKLTLFFLLFMACAMLSCSSNSTSPRAVAPDTLAESIADSCALAGKWIIATTSSNDTTQHGFVLNADSSALSLHFGTIDLKRWHLNAKGDSLMLVGYQLAPDNTQLDTLRYGMMLKADTMIMTPSSGKVQVYHRQRPKPTSPPQKMKP